VDQYRDENWEREKTWPGNRRTMQEVKARGKKKKVKLNRGTKRKKKQGVQRKSARKDRTVLKCCQHQKDRKMAKERKGVMVGFVRSRTINFKGERQKVRGKNDEIHFRIVTLPEMTKARKNRHTEKVLGKGERICDLLGGEGGNWGGKRRKRTRKVSSNLKYEVSKKGDSPRRKKNGILVPMHKTCYRKGGDRHEQSTREHKGRKRLRVPGKETQTFRKEEGEGQRRRKEIKAGGKKNALGRCRGEKHGTVGKQTFKRLNRMGPTS